MKHTSQKISDIATFKMAEYHVGDRDERPWGHYIVTGVGRHANGEEYCKKLIVVKSGKLLSLQSHELRRETWTVIAGTLTVVLDGNRITMPAGQSVHIPQGSIHCMANLGQEDCIVEELQEGLCREDDIKRYLDAYQRATEETGDAAAIQSRAVYKDILSEIEGARFRGGADA